MGKWERLNAGENNGKLPLRTCPDAAYQSHAGRLSGLWFLPKLAQGPNTNNKIIIPTNSNCVTSSVYAVRLTFPYMLRVKQTILKENW